MRREYGFKHRENSITIGLFWQVISKARMPGIDATTNHQFTLVDDLFTALLADGSVVGWLIIFRRGFLIPLARKPAILHRA
jgi:hypothetical protein